MLPYSGGSACLSVCYHEKKEWLVLLIKIEPPIRLKLIKKFSWTEATESLIQNIVAKSCKFDAA